MLDNLRNLDIQALGFRGGKVVALFGPPRGVPIGLSLAQDSLESHGADVGPSRVGAATWQGPRPSSVRQDVVIEDRIAVILTRRIRAT